MIEALLVKSSTLGGLTVGCPKPRTKGTRAEANVLGKRLAGSSENIRPVVAVLAECYFINNICLLRDSLFS